LNKRVGRHLVELLVAGLTIAGVGALIATVDIRATERARTLQCSGNVHQLTLALTQYADDHDGKLPLGPNWQMQMLTYSQREEDPRVTVLACPSRSNEPGFATGLNVDLAGRRADSVVPQLWLIEVRNGSAQTWWANDIRYHPLTHNRFPVAPHRNRATFSRGDGSVKSIDPSRLTATDWTPTSDEHGDAR
jgi:hypothetical protein